MDFFFLRWWKDDTDQGSKRGHQPSHHGQAIIFKPRINLCKYLGGVMQRSDEMKKVQKCAKKK